MQTGSEPSRDLVLIGGGHSHLSVIKQLAMQPIAGLRITVVSRDIHTPYSGMLPGLIAGHYQHDQCFIDLRRLCQWAGIRLFHSRATHIDSGEQLVHCDNRPPLRYDWLSINTGSTPQLGGINGADQYGIGVKPIDKFLASLERWLAKLSAGPTLTVVGGGAASVELILAIQYRIEHMAEATRPRFQLVSADQRLLPGYSTKVSSFFSQLLQQRGIDFYPNYRVTDIDASQLTGTGQTPLATDFTIWALGASAPAWFAQSGLRLDKAGFVLVSEQLQSLSHSNIFAAGDCASFAVRPLPKSGVYAVRQGKLLAQNIRRAIAGNPLARYRPQRRFLSLLATGDRQAVASRGRLFASGAWVWRWKSHIDRGFMDRFNNPGTAMSRGAAPEPESVQRMRCGGCGAKVGAEALQQVLQRLARENGIGNAAVIEDAAVSTPPAGQQMLQSIDFFRAFIDDPYLVGKIAANHCLGDIYAMGARPDSALALANVPFSHLRIMQDTLYQLMRGAIETLQQAGVSLLGGHSSEAAELAFGLTVNGFIEPGAALPKAGLQPGQALILTKPLGTGTLLAANMLHLARGRWVEGALESMQQSNAQAAVIMRRHGATACTDITGFGLLGHLLEMLQASGYGARLVLDAIPILPGAGECLRRGWFSSLHRDNAWHGSQLTHSAEELSASMQILYDPQTAGGLLFGIPPDETEACLAALEQASYRAARVGEICPLQPGVSGRVELV